MEPPTAAGYFTFYTFYLFPPTRPAFLGSYPYILRTTEGGFLPSGIDEFLAGRLWEPDSREWRAILEFYIAQGPGRWGDACGRLHESLKPRLVRHLLSSIDSDPPEIQVDKLVFIEYLRLDGKLYKGNFHHGTVWHWDESQRYAIYDSVKIHQAISAFRNWFATNSEWSILRVSSPLQGTNMEISGIP